jgi:uncharacterized protein YbjT (DUF2867 family)
MPKTVLVTGATGYVAARLIPALLTEGYHVRCLARSPGKLRNRHWLGDVEVFTGDVLDTETLYPALKDVHYAYYLIHSMASGGKYRTDERIGAMNFGKAAFESGLEHIIFLGGLGGSNKGRHMHSRQETGNQLRESGVPVTEFRSSVVIGSGSISFELIRYLTTWFPIIPAPVRARQPSQPIGIVDLLAYLLMSLENPACRGEIIEIGGPEIINYPDLMVKFAKENGFKRSKLWLPPIPNSIAAHVAGMLTPVPFEIAYPLMEELEAPSVVHQVKGSEYFFGPKPLSTYIDSVKFAISRKEYEPNLPWTASLVTREPLVKHLFRTVGEGFVIDHRESMNSDLSDLGKNMLQGHIPIGWEIDEIGSGSWIRVRKSIGRAGLIYLEVQFSKSRLMQTTLFEPNGLIGFLWWYCLLPFHSNWLKKLFMKLVGKQ